MWNADHLRQALNLKERPAIEDAQGVSIDTRTLEKGNIFVALKGPTHDGHDHVSEALSKGAAAALVETLQTDVPVAKQILVPSTYEALEMLGKYARAHTQATIIGVTGSHGKTTVKEFLGHVFSPFAKTIAARETYNNDIGVPLSLAHLNPDARYGIFEIGMNNPGEIAPLAHQVSPHIAIITGIGDAHIGRMGGADGIAEEKSEIFTALQSNGTAVLPMDNPHYGRMLKKAQKHAQHVYTFGTSKDATARLISFTPHENGTGSDVTVEVEGKTYTYPLNIPGEHSVHNSLIILLASKAAGLALDEVLPHMATFTPIKGRGQRHTLTYKNGTITLIDDAYNANPTSMRAGLSVLAATKPASSGRRIAVLGTMVELGEKSADYHKALSPVIEGCGVDLVFASGEEMRHLYTALPANRQGAYATQATDIIQNVMDEVRPGDVVFVKGSKSSYISKVVDAFLQQ